MPGILAGAGGAGSRTCRPLRFGQYEKAECGLFPHPASLPRRCFCVRMLAGRQACPLPACAAAALRFAYHVRKRARRGGRCGYGRSRLAGIALSFRGGSGRRRKKMPAVPPLSFSRGGMPGDPASARGKTDVKAKGRGGIVRLARLVQCGGGGRGAFGRRGRHPLRPRGETARHVCGSGGSFAWRSPARGRRVSALLILCACGAGRASFPRTHRKRRHPI